MKRLEKQNILNQFNLNEIINHFQNGIDSIENQFNIADYLTPKENELYNELRVRMGEKDTRLEQEYIPYHYVLERLKGIGLL